MKTASNRGDIEQLRRLFENRVDPNIRQYDKRTAIHQVWETLNSSRFPFVLKGLVDFSILRSN
jgi:hypothetical protein